LPLVAPIDVSGFPVEDTRVGRLDATAHRHDREAGQLIAVTVSTSGGAVEA